MESGRYVLLIFILLALLAGLYYGFNRPVDDSGTVPDSQEENPRQELSNFTLNQNLADDEIWRLSAPRAIRYSEKIKLLSPHVVYTVDGDTRLTIAADEGEYRRETQLLTLIDNVVLRRVQQDQILRTSRLKWNKSTELIMTEQRVRLLTPQGTLKARGMKTRLKEDTIQFLSDVRFSSR
jgi:LPS export ABC transporter protein LptC